MSARTRHLTTLTYLLSPPRIGKKVSFGALDPRKHYTTELRNATRLWSHEQPTTPSAKRMRVYRTSAHAWNSMYGAMFAELTRKYRLHIQWKYKQEHQKVIPGSPPPPSAPGMTIIKRPLAPRTLFERERVSVVGYARNAQDAIDQVSELISHLPAQTVVIDKGRPLWHNNVYQRRFGVAITWIAQNASNSQRIRRILLSIENVLFTSHKLRGQLLSLPPLPYDMKEMRLFLLFRFREELDRILNSRKLVRSENSTVPVYVGVHEFNYFVHLQDSEKWVLFFLEKVQSPRQFAIASEVLFKNGEEQKKLLPWYAYTRVDLAQTMAFVDRAIQAV